MANPLTIVDPHALAEVLHDVRALLFAVSAMGNDLADNGALDSQDAGDALARLATQARARLFEVIVQLDL